MSRTTLSGSAVPALNSSGLWFLVLLSLLLFLPYAPRSGEIFLWGAGGNGWIVGTRDGILLKKMGNMLKNTGNVLKKMGNVLKKTGNVLKKTGNHIGLPLRDPLL